MSVSENYYDVLGVNRGCDGDEIKRAYRKLALELHPDRNRGNKSAEDRFKKVVMAYEVLRDPGKRAEYDIGFNHTTGSFDPSSIDPRLLDPDEFIGMFSKLFGDYLDVRIPGGFRGRVEKAARGAESEKRQSEKSNNQPEGGEARGRCPTCSGRGYILLSQGGIKISVKCKDCS